MQNHLRGDNVEENVRNADHEKQGEKAVIDASQFGEDGLMLQKGKKGFRRLILK